MLLEVRSDGVTARADGRADGDEEIAGAGVELSLEGSDAGADDACSGSPPAGVEGSGGAADGVDDEDWHAVGCKDGEEKAGFIGDQAVGFGEALSKAGSGSENGGGVNLVDHGEFGST